MSDGSLSQDEIDALLQGGGGMDFGSPAEPAPAAAAGLSEQEKQDFLGLLNTTLASQSSNLNNLLNDTVKLENPVIEVADNSALGAVFSRGEC